MQTGSHPYRWLGIVFLLALLGACRPPTGGQEASPSRKTPPRPQVNLRPAAWEMAVFYALDDKYYQETAEADLQKWATEQLSRILDAAPVPGDLFAHQGGGPMGAEWNSDADLVLFLWTKTAHSGTLPAFTFKLNGEAHPLIQLTLPEAGSAFVVHLPAKTWVPALREIKEADFPLLYDAEALKLHAEGAGSPVGVGKILTIEVIVSENQKVRQNLLKAFHIAYGE